MLRICRHIMSEALMITIVVRNPGGLDDVRTFNDRQNRQRRGHRFILTYPMRNDFVSGPPRRTAENVTGYHRDIAQASEPSHAVANTSTRAVSICSAGSFLPPWRMMTSA